MPRQSSLPMVLPTRVVDMDAGWDSSLAAPTRPTADVALGDEEGLFELVAERGSLTRLARNERVCVGQCEVRYSYFVRSGNVAV